MSLENMHILIVDDDQFVRETLKDLLELEGASISLANDGLQAFELVTKAESKFDLVLSDIRMPNCTGIEFLNKIRSYEGKVPDVILISGFTDISEKQATELGAKGIFMKKNVLDRLLEYVRKKKEEKEPVIEDVLAEDGNFNILKFSIN